MVMHFLQRFLVVVAFASAVATGQELSVVHLGDSVVLRSDLTLTPDERALILRRSLDLESWNEIGRFRNILYPYSLPFLSESGSAFYQVHSRRSQPILCGVINSDSVESENSLLTDFSVSHAQIHLGVSDTSRWLP